MSEPQRAKNGRFLSRPSEPDTGEPGEPSPGELRDRLSTAISAFQQTEAQVLALEQSQTRAQDQLRAAAARLNEVEAAAADLKQISPDDVWAFTLGEQLQSRQSRAAAEAAVAAAREELGQAEELERAVENELTALRSRLGLRRGTLLDAAANFVGQSPELAALLSSLEQAWSRVRSLQFTCAQIGTRLGGRLPNSFLTSYQRVWPVCFADDFPSAPVDSAVAMVWIEALDKLLAGDATATLPGAPR
jgi:predicted  nucleic acid-binding Zn-ribbon protein